MPVRRLCHGKYLYTKCLLHGCQSVRFLGPFYLEFSSLSLEVFNNLGGIVNFAGVVKGIVSLG